MLYFSHCIHVIQKQKHNGWKFILWTNKDIDKSLAINPKYKWLFNEYRYKKIVYPAQKDILEYLILYKYGGIYFDADVECLKNMDEIAYKYKFFATIEPPSRWSRIPVVMGGMAGSSPRNKIIADALDIAAINYKNIYKKKNNSFFKKIARKIFKGKYVKIPDSKNALMVPLTEAIVKNGVQPETIAFPATYFDSVFPKVKRYDLLDEIKFLLGIYKNRDKLFTRLKPEAICVLRDFVTSEDQLVIKRNGG